MQPKLARLFFYLVIYLSNTLNYHKPFQYLTKIEENIHLKFLNQIKIFSEFKIKINKNQIKIIRLKKNLNQTKIFSKLKFNFEIFIKHKKSLR